MTFIIIIIYFDFILLFSTFAENLSDLNKHVIQLRVNNQAIH